MADPYANLVSADPYATVAAPPNAPLPNAIQAFGGGFNRSLAAVLDLVGKPVEAVRSFVTKTPQQGPPFQRAFEEMGLIPPVAPGLSADIGRMGGEFAAGGLGIGAGAAVAAGRVGGGVLQNILQQLTPRTLNQLVLDVTTAITAGAGAAVGQRVGERVEEQLTGGPPVSAGATLGEFGGALAGGGLNPTTILLQHIPASVRQLVRRFGERGQVEMANRIVRTIVQNGLRESGAQAGLARGEELSRLIPGFKPSLAESTGAQTLIREQEFVQATAQGAGLVTLKQREAANLDALRDFRGAVTPEGPEISAVIDAATRHVDGLLSPITAEASRLVPRISTGATQRSGAILRQRYERLRGATKSAFDRNFASLRSRLGSEDIASPVLSYARGLQDELVPTGIFARAEDVAPVLRERVLPLLREEGEALPSITIRDLMDLRTKLSDGIIDAVSGTAPNRAWVRQMTIAKTRLDTLLKELPLGAEYKNLISRYFSDYISRFEQGLAFKTGQRDVRGFIQTTDEKVAGQFADGSYDSAMQFRRTFAGDPRALKAFQSAVVDDFRIAAVRDGQINSKLAETWMRQHEGMLRVFPDLNVSAETLLIRQLENTALRQEIENTSLARSLEGLSKETLSAEQILERALVQPALARSLIASVRDNPSAQAALRRWLFEHAPDQSLAQYLENPLVKSSLEPAHRAHLTAIFDAKQMTARVGPATGQPEEVVPLGPGQRFLGMQIPQVASRWFAAASGRTSERWVLTEGAARLFNKLGIARGRALVEKALFDPEVAQAIANQIRLKDRDPAMRLIRPWLVYYGLQGIEVDQGDQGDRRRP